MSGAIAYEGDHAGVALSRLLQQFRGNDDVEALCALVPAGRAQLVEDAVFGLIAGRQLDTAIGAQLDGLGRIVGQPRGGQADDVYRVRIRARILVNKSSGTAPELLAILNLLADVGVTPLYRPEPAAGASFLMLGVASLFPTELARSIASAKAAGVNIVIIWDTGPAAGMARFDSTTPGQRFDEGVFAGSLNTD